MAGKIKKMIDTIIEQRSKGSRIIAGTIKVKLILKGINPDSFNHKSNDNPLIIKQLEKFAKDFGVDFGRTLSENEKRFSTWT
jgi:hypothetical protein